MASQDRVRARGTFGEFVIRRPTLTPDSLVGAADSLGTPGPHVGLGDVRSIQVRGGAAGTGALVGAGVGVAVGLVDLACPPSAAMAAAVMRAVVSHSLRLAPQPP